MAVTIPQFRTRFPEFGGESDARIQLYLDDAGLEINDDQWGVLADRGHLYLAAHFTFLACKREAGEDVDPGQIKSEQVGEVRQSYAVSEPGADNMNQELYVTPYGKEYLRLRKMCFPSRY